MTKNPNSTNPSEQAQLTPAQALEVLYNMDVRLATLARLGRAVWLCGVGLKEVAPGDDCGAVVELGEQIETIANAIAKEHGKAYFVVKAVVDGKL